MKKLLLLLSAAFILLNCNRTKIDKCCTGVPQITAVDTSVLAMPNIFTPNADGVNDVLDVLKKNISPNGFKFTVTSKSGRKIIFETTDPNLGWNGNYKGKFAKEREYNFDIVATTINGSLISLSGKVCMIRDNCATGTVENCFFATQFNGSVFDTSLPSYETLKPCH